MTIEVLKSLFIRDLNKLHQEISSYEDPELMWIVSGEINNSAGNLCMHIVGNLRYFIGHVIGKTTYQRDRVAEFNGKMTMEQLNKEIELAQADLTFALDSSAPEKLQEYYPLEVFGHPMTHEYFLIHLYGHLNYHLGQINYHRRLVTPSSK